MNKRLNIGLLFLVMALIVVPGVSAHASYDMACNTPGCHSISSAISITATTPKTIVAPGESFVVTETWSPSTATAKWPSVVNDNALFGIPSGGLIVSGSGTGTTTLKAPSATGSYKVTVYAATISGGLITNFQDIAIIVQAAPVDTSRPSVTINQAAIQADPTGTSPINFAVVFNESVTGFATGDVTLGGTAGATTATVTGSGTTYNVAVTGMISNGTVIATIGANVAQDAAGNLNTASTSTDNTVNYTIATIPPSTGKANVTFIVTDRQGHAIGDAIVSMNGINIKTDVDGKAIFTNVVPGAYLYKVTKEGYSGISKRIVVKGDMTVKVTLRTRNGGHR